MALEEAHLPWEVDEKLDTKGAYDFSGKLKGAMTAHPRICPKTGELLFFSYSMMSEPYLTYYRTNPLGELVQIEPIELPRAVMMHDWNITENHVVFMDLPIISDMNLAVETGSPFGFKPEFGARLGVMPREGSNSDVRWFDIDPCYVFHPLNSYEEGNKIIGKKALFKEVASLDSSLMDNFIEHVKNHVKNPTEESANLIADVRCWTSWLANGIKIEPIFNGEKTACSFIPWPLSGLLLLSSRIIGQQPEFEYAADYVLRLSLIHI